jgi:hypothetical protein
MVAVSMKAVLFGVYALLLVLTLTSFVRVSSKRHKFDFDALEKEWEKGDSEEELQRESERSKKVAEKLMQGGSALPEMPYMSFDDPDEVLKQLNKHEAEKKKATKKAKGRGIDPRHLKGGGLMFLELDTAGHKHLSDPKARDKLASQWKDMMHNAALQADIFVISEEKFLFQVDKPWLVQDVLKFAATRPEVKMVTLDNNNYYGKDFDDEL